MKDIRVAVCMFGQARTGMYCAPYIKEGFNFKGVTFTVGHPGEKKEECRVVPDFFCYSKDYETNGNVRGRMPHDLVKRLTPQELMDLYSLYKPLAYGTGNMEMETLIRDMPHSNESVMLWRYPIPFLLGILNVIRLKQTFEVNAGIQYDMTICQRFDAITEPCNLLDHVLTQYGLRRNVIYSTFVSNFRDENNALGFGDFWFGGDNLSMDLMATSLHRWIFEQERTNKDLNETMSSLGPNVALYEAAAENGLQVINLQARANPVRPESDLTLDVFQSFRRHEAFFIDSHPAAL